MSQFAKIIAATGLALLVTAGIVWMMGKLGVRGLPGDIVYRSERGTFVFPIVTCVVLSIVISVVLWLVRSMGK